MSKYGWRDSHIKAKSVNLNQKRFKEDIYVGVVASTTEIYGSFALSTVATVLTRAVGTTQGHPRAVKIINTTQAAGGTSGRYIIVKGYTGQGQYEEERLLLGTSVDSYVRGAVPFAKITQVRQDPSTKSIGTYGTAAMYPTNLFGLSEYCEGGDDGLYVREISISGAGVLATAFDTDGNFSKTNQTIKVGGAAAASTIAISYLSKFQKANEK